MILKTYYDNEEVKRVQRNLNSNEIHYQLNNKSNLTNFRGSIATYTEVNLLIKASDYAKAYNLLLDSFL